MKKVTWRINQTALEILRDSITKGDPDKIKELDRLLELERLNSKIEQLEYDNDRLLRSRCHHKHISKRLRAKVKRLESKLFILGKRIDNYKEKLSEKGK